MADKTRKFKIETGEFLDAVRTAARARSSRKTVEVLGAVHMRFGDGKVEVTGTDLDAAIRASAPCRVSGSAFECVPLDPKRLIAGLGTLDGMIDGTVHVSSSGGRSTLELQSGPTKLVYEGALAVDFPQLPSDWKEFARVPIDEFRAIWRAVKTARSRDDSRPVLTGVKMEIDQGTRRLRMITTDSYRLAHAVGRASSRRKSFETTVTGQALEHIDKVFGKVKDRDLVIGESGKMVSFTLDGTTVMGRTIDGQFPNWKQLIPDNFDGEVELPREETLEILTRMAKLSSGHHALEVHIEPGKPVIFLLRSGGTMQAQTELHPPKMNVPSRIEFGLNAAFAAEAFAAFESDIVRLNLISPLRPFYLSVPLSAGDSRDQGVLLMPIRLPQDVSWNTSRKAPQTRDESKSVASV